MSEASPRTSHTLTLWLCGILHAFTHLYQVVLIPLYFLIRDDLHLATVESATVLVTAQLMAYFLPSYLMGILADHSSRKKLLAWGLALNGAAFMLLSYARSYPMALAAVILAGLGGSFYHPAATALIARLYPKSTGRALGLVGIGAGAGFFLGPLIAGWRAAHGGWRTPVFETGVAGLVMAGVFAFLAEDFHAGQTNSNPAAPYRPKERMFPTRALLLIFFLASAAFSLRDFTGSSMSSLGSLFLQEAHGFSVGRTGSTLSAIFLAATVSNPLFGRLSDAGRLRWTTLVLIMAGGCVALVPLCPPGWLPVVFGLYGFFFMASYPMIEAALMESVHDSVRGRVYGAFILVSGVVGNLAHWLSGKWVERLGANAGHARAYIPVYSALAVLIFASLLGIPALKRIGGGGGVHPPQTP